MTHPTDSTPEDASAMEPNPFDGADAFDSEEPMPESAHGADPDPDSEAGGAPYPAGDHGQGNAAHGLDLRRPLAFFDLETTGTDPAEDRIVEISVLKVHPDGTEEVKTRRIDPGVPIPESATAIHGIRDEDVADEPRFVQVARSLADFLEDCDLGGFGIVRFDVPLLCAEFERADVPFDVRDRAIVDALTIFHRREPRNLEAALRFYCDERLEDAHSAESDIRATYRVLQGQIERYTDLPREPGAIDEEFNPGRRDFVDSQGKIVWQGEEAAFNFGKHRGQLVREVASNSPDYLDWLLKKDFSREVKEILERARQGELPKRSSASAR